MPAVSPDARLAAPVFDASFRARLDDLFRWRRDVRHFRRDPVPPALLDQVLAAADLAPSVGLSQPWRFVRVESGGCRAAIRADFARCNAAALALQPAERAGTYARLKLAGLDEAPCHLAVFVEDDPAQGHGLGRATMPETTAFSAILAIHTLWLAARAAGLGLGWVSILDPARMSAILDVPPAWRFLAYLCLGFPDEAHDMPELERLGWETRRRTEPLVR